MENEDTPDWIQAAAQQARKDIHTVAKLGGGRRRRQILLTTVFLPVGLLRWLLGEWAMWLSVLFAVPGGLVALSDRNWPRTTLAGYWLIGGVLVLRERKYQAASTRLCPW